MSYSLGDHLACCTGNYLQMIRLQVSSYWEINLKEKGKLSFERVSESKYTEAWVLTYHWVTTQPWLKDTALVVRLYHDAKLAEVVSFQNHTVKLKDKESTNKLLFEWLTLCLSMKKSID